MLIARCILFLITCGSTNTWAGPLAPRYLNTTSNIYAPASAYVTSKSPTYSLPVIVTADASSAAISSDLSIAQTAEPFGKSSSTTSATTTSERTSDDSSSATFSYMPTTAPSSDLAATGSSSPYTSARDAPTTEATNSVATTVPIHFSYAPDATSQAETKAVTSATSSGLADSSIERSITFLTLYTTVYRSSNSGVATTASSRSVATSYGDSGSSDRGAETSIMQSSSVISQTHGDSTLPAITTRSETLADSTTTTAVVSSEQLSAEVKPTMSTQVACSGQPLFPYAPEPTTTSMSSEPSSSSYPVASQPSGTLSLSSLTSQPKAGGITIIPVDPNAGRTVTVTDAAATQTVTETVARKTITVTA